MNGPEFLVYLGGGLYMDSDGLVVHNPPPNRPIYQLPSGELPVKPDTLQKTLQGISKAFPDPKKDVEYRTMLGRLGVPDIAMTILFDLGQVASALATVVGIVGFAVDIGKLIGIFKGGADPLETLIKTRFDSLENELRAVETETRLVEIAALRATIQGGLDDVAEFITEMKNYPFSSTRLETRLQDMRSKEANVRDAVFALTDPAMWMFTFDGNLYKEIDPSLDGLLFAFPPGSASSMARFPQQNTTRFDHRMMIFEIPYAVTAFLNLLKTVSPEYRTTGEFVEDLRTLAGKLDKLAVAMISNALTRTLYNSSHFDYTWAKNSLLQNGTQGPDPNNLKLDPEKMSWIVGAADTCIDTDAFLESDQVKLYAAVNFQFSKRASLDFRWMPSKALIEPYVPFGTSQTAYRITNPGTCAEDANQQSERDYADLLVSSGYLNLSQVAVLARHLATEPDRTETISGGVYLHRLAGKYSLVTAQSPEIPLIGKIVSSATLEPFSITARAYLGTQPPGRQRAIHYRVVLRALRGVIADDINFTQYYSTSYIADPEHPGFQKLLVSADSGMVQGEYELISGTTPQEQRSEKYTASFEASTYDWYVPTKPPLSAWFEKSAASTFKQSEIHGLMKSAQALVAATYQNDSQASTDIQPPDGELSSPSSPGSSLMTLSGSLSHYSVSDMFESDFSIIDFLGEEVIEPINGQKRNRRTETVEVQYDLTWNAGELKITLTTSPQDRNYNLYLVIEEELVSRQILQTWYPIPVTGQITYVPQAFFDQEKEAIGKVNSMFNDFTRRYSINHHTGPLDPFVRQFTTSALLDHSDLQNLFRMAEAADPEIMAEITRGFGE